MNPLPAFPAPSPAMLLEECAAPLGISGKQLIAERGTPNHSAAKAHAAWLMREHGHSWPVIAKAIREEKDLPSPATLVKHARAIRAEDQPRKTEAMPPMSEADKAAMQADIERWRRTGRFSVPEATGGQA